MAAGDATFDQVPKSAGDVRRQIAGFHRREALLVLEDGAEILGWGIIKRYSDRAGYRFTCETGVYLRRDLTGRGLGTRIKEALIERCRRYGYHHLVAKVVADNAASLAYNRKLGFEVVGIQREVGYQGGRWRDVVVLELLLDDVAPEIPEKYREESP